MIGPSIWHFRAEGDPTHIHTVTRNQGGYKCTCPVFAYGGGKDCRHVRLVKNGLAGLPINEEPQLAWATVNHVQKYRGKVLVPFFRNEDMVSMYLVLYELRQLGISKRACCTFMGIKAVSDATVERYLRQQGLLLDTGEVRPALCDMAPNAAAETTLEGMSP